MPRRVASSQPSTRVTPTRPKSILHETTSMAAVSPRGTAPAGSSASHALPQLPNKVNTVVDMPYFTPAQIERLSARARANKMPVQKWEQTRLSACAFIAALGAKLGWCV